MEGGGRESNPFLGCRISLVSRADIRYEGELEAVDHRGANISLRAVRSFGTEGRARDLFIPPRAQLFDCVIFKAKDIKDLRIYSRDGSVLPEQEPLADPAIVSVETAAPDRPAVITQEFISHTLPFKQSPVIVEEGEEEEEEEGELSDSGEGELKDDVSLAPLKQSELEPLGLSSEEAAAGWDGGPVKLLFNRGRRHFDASNNSNISNNRAGSRLRPTARPFHPGRMPPPPPLPPALLRHGFLGHGMPLELPLCRRPGLPDPAPCYEPYLQHQQRHFLQELGWSPESSCPWDIPANAGYDTDYDFEAANASFAATMRRESGGGGVGLCPSGLKEVGTAGQIRKPEQAETAATATATVTTETGAYEPAKCFFDRLGSQARLGSAWRATRLAPRDLETFGELALPPPPEHYAFPPSVATLGNGGNVMLGSPCTSPLPYSMRR